MTYVVEVEHEMNFEKATKHQVSSPDYLAWALAARALSRRDQEAVRSFCAAELEGWWQGVSASETRAGAAGPWSVWGLAAVATARVPGHGRGAVSSGGAWSGAAWVMGRGAAGAGGECSTGDMVRCTNWMRLLDAHRIFL